MDFTSLAEKFGPVTAIAAVVGYTLYRFASWAGEKVVLPITQRHLQFLDKVETGLDRLGAAMDRLARNQQEIADSLPGTPATRTRSKSPAQPTE